ncbi:MAG TPA: amidophosphoribosyltransferase [Spirochaetes bacterium]|nr:amidophosphoribosyltransferase [Spirochaetota bacterium]
MHSNEFTDENNGDKLKEACGVIGVISRDKSYNVCEPIYLGLYSLQHRGQESAGIATYYNEFVNIKRGNGLLTNVFKPDDFEVLKGNAGIGHVRYSTTGSGYIQNVQPIIARYWGGMMAISHNGNIVNSKELRNKLIENGAIIHSSSDTEIILHLIAQEKERCLEKAILSSIHKIMGAYSIVQIAGEKLIGIRDPYGFRPLCLGKMIEGYVIASETTALDIIGANFLRDIQPGEMVVCDGNDIKSYMFKEKQRNALCVFEYIYFARADSIIDGISVYEVRKKMGSELARMSNITADVVIPVPDSGITTAIGFSREAGIPFEIGLFKNSYVGRTFIHPGTSERGARVKIKLNPIKSVLKGKRVAVVDDSIVRGTTSKRIIKMIRNAGANEVHLYISAPPITHPCFFGIDTSIKKTLIASTQSVEDIRRYLDVDTLTYITIDGLSKAVGKPLNTLCYACFNGDYPIPVAEESEDGKLLLEEYRVLER